MSVAVNQGLEIWQTRHYFHLNPHYIFFLLEPSLQLRETDSAVNVVMQ